MLKKQQQQWMEGWKNEQEKTKLCSKKIPYNVKDIKSEEWREELVKLNVVEKND